LCHFFINNNTYRHKIQKQIKEDFNLAKELSVTDTATLPKKSHVVVSSSSSNQIQHDGPCSSKTADFFDSLALPNDNQSSINGGEDDRMIAELLQAEFDKEFDEEVKRVEASRNKSESAIS
jgi:hypothetical protein